MKHFVTYIVKLVDNSKATKQFVKFLEKYSTLPYEVYFLVNNITNKHRKYIVELCNANHDIHFVEMHDNENYLSDIFSEMQGTLVFFTTNSNLITKKSTKSIAWYFKNIDDLGILAPKIYTNPLDDLDEKIKEAKQNRKLYKRISENIIVDGVDKECFILNEKILTDRKLLSLIDNKNISLDDIFKTIEKENYKIKLAKDVIMLSLSLSAKKMEDESSNDDKLDIQENTELVETAENKEIENKIDIKEKLNYYKNLVNSQQDVISNYEKAKNMLQNKNYEHALGYLIYATEKYLIDLSVKNIELKDLYSLAGQISLYLEEPKLSLYFFEEELKLEDNSSRACEGLADALILNNEVLKAKYMYQWAVKCDPQNINAKNKLARLNNLLGLPEEDITEEL
ncbi:MAG TPA: hypothetical protein PK591_03785 [Ignavibacteriales bacterium]|nr:hypothetical protein [Ignavibacteriales bacterium]